MKHPHNHLRNALLLGTLLLPSVAGAQALYFTTHQNGQWPLFINGDALYAGPALPAFTFTGTVAINTNGSVTTGLLSVTAAAGTTPPIIPIGSLLTGGTVTTGTTVVSQIDNLHYRVIATGGTIAASASATLTATPKMTPNIQDIVQKTAPTYASGGCTAGTPAFVSGSSPFSWSFTNGTGTCTGGNTVTFTFPAAPVAWMCYNLVDTSNPTTDFYVSTGAASTTAVVLTDYSSAGAAQNTKANDVITGQCVAR